MFLQTLGERIETFGMLILSLEPKVTDYVIKTMKIKKPNKSNHNIEKWLKCALEGKLGSRHLINLSFYMVLSQLGTPKSDFCMIFSWYWPLVSTH